MEKQTKEGWNRNRIEGQVSTINNKDQEKSLGVRLTLLTKVKDRYKAKGVRRKMQEFVRIKNICYIF